MLRARNAKGRFVSEFSVFQITICEPDGGNKDDELNMQDNHVRSDTDLFVETTI